MMVNALKFVLETLGNLWLLVVLLRFLAQFMRVTLRARAGNPIADFIMALTDWAVLPLRRVLPRFGRVDLASFLVALLGAVMLQSTILLLLGLVDPANPLFWPGLLFYSLVALLKLTVYLFIGLLIVQAVLSWVSPYHPLRPFFEGFTRPLLRPVQRMVPPIGGVDLSPLFLILILQVMLMLPITWLDNQSVLLLSRAAT
jgi:YggT family protein